MKLTQILTKKLTSFWLVSLAAVAFVFLLCALMSFIQLTYRFQQSKVTELESMIVAHYQQHGERQLDTWLPVVLKAYHAQRFHLNVADKVLFTYQTDVRSISHSNLTLYQHVIDADSGLSMTLAVPPPFSAYQLGWYETLILLIGLGAIGVFVRYGLKWIGHELEGVEQLALRSKLILDGDIKAAKSQATNGRPRLINRAISRLLDELDDAKQERGRLDQFIRANTFLDPITNIGNRLYLENRLDALSHDNKMVAHGVIFLLEFNDDALMDVKADIEADRIFLTQIVATISPLINEHSDVIFARKTPLQFIIVIPQLSLDEADLLADRLLRNCLLVKHHHIVNHDNYLHFGGAFYKTGEQPLLIIEEAEMALRAAQLQRINTWFMYDKGAVDQEIAKGSVRWRSFLENALVNKRFVVLTQPVVDSDDIPLHYEVFSRVRDNKNNEVRATLFIPMANKCGLMPQVERQVIEKVLFGLMQNNTLTYSVNLSMDTLTSRAFIRWIQSTLLEHRPLAARLIFEVSEDIFIKYQQHPQLAKTLTMLSKMGAKLSVDHVGRQVVGTQYIQNQDFDFVKLDRSIIRQVHERPENQLYIRSLIGGLLRSKAQVIAEGVEMFEEWQTLKILGVSAAQGQFLGDAIAW
ncbi:RNase E specificity factor CsrD [Shewanella sp. OMA3-2]|uniref:RNase E specificity factor CsrD n=1 Tax=Shewanella sp. OMA3-2 TaxID=2908650 RepID=UPI001F2798AA|nr:RNase E specificity factor CsrD [Shewanella sp. OMA3-2]UJF21993.1 RNase E specificity factor CsrD [Shewanella sp. OMA3-2]